MMKNNNDCSCDIILYIYLSTEFAPEQNIISSLYVYHIFESPILIVTHGSVLRKSTFSYITPLNLCEMFSYAH